MTKTIFRVALVGAMAALPLAAQAQTPQGPYVALQGGVNFNIDRELSVGGVDADVETDLGYAAGGTAGYAFGGGPRVELEATWRRNNIDNIGPLSNDGDLSSVALMVNALYDIPTGTKFYPYVGAGIGWVIGMMDSDIADGTSGAFGYQGIAGVGYNITDNVGMTLDYRFLGTTGMKFDAVADRDSDYDNYLNHTVMLGLRYSFGTPAPKPAPMPVQPVVEQKVVEVPESYLVFFDFDSTAITPEAAGIISTAASNAKAKGTSTIEVTGHADRSGSPEYNMRLSTRRAESVMAELGRNGIPRSQVAVFAKGEADPLVPTPDGVREPQNRRVVIILK
ncbi:OmpA family protein [Pararhodospirillum oryzae]|uniref:Membrane protein n=1 Tax=Pararhodospirillum oryzae TaxID=478448 RepID=A0A512H4E3_9PROT|nr:OmpA family protein [Pararhodospirillum oryzae]GEO80288.1 membrane protein [Pararhodospirillum oryzae]